jgi:hypothetical protein
LHVEKEKLPIDTASFKNECRPNFNARAKIFLKRRFTSRCVSDTCALVDPERRIRRYEKLGDYSIEPYGEKFYGLYKGTELVAVFVYKRGALEVMRRLWRSEKINGKEGV